MGHQQKIEEVSQGTAAIAAFPLQIKKVFRLYSSMMFSRAHAYKGCESSKTVHGAGVPVQLWADRCREDTHHAGQQGPGRAGHHTQGHPQGVFLHRSCVAIMTIHERCLVRSGPHDRLKGTVSTHALSVVQLTTVDLLEL